MGDPKKQRKKYKKPIRPWEGTRIVKEKSLLKVYGLKNKKELWKAESILRSFRDQAKRLTAATSEQAKKEEKQLIEKLSKLNLIKKDSKVDDILSLELKDILDRRLQTLVYKRRLARSVKQARQFIIHGHVYVDGKKVDVPSYCVNIFEEDKIYFNPSSELAKNDHPERVKVKVKEEKVKKKIKEEKVKKEKKVEEKVKEEPKIKSGGGEKMTLESYNQYKEKKKMTTEKILDDLEREDKEKTGRQQVVKKETKR